MNVNGVSPTFESSSSLKGETVTMNVNGVLYSKITNANGIASLNIDLLPGEYIITASHGTAVTSNIISVKEN
ncbi:MAG: hypothetical protein MR504_07000 [Methanobrevibacter woesei]|uniref:hypothetical protein n=1 Tax=Methanobrevibacter woesei TaxID=190976 RepID=UPI0023F27FFB|nr:hypothetical protein [Methanobrevibacter woesei]MCI7291922.1 hypothetical protein [Methanobrevibacter woesei]